VEGSFGVTPRSSYILDYHSRKLYTSYQFDAIPGVNITHEFESVTRHHQDQHPVNLTLLYGSRPTGTSAMILSLMVYVFLAPTTVRRDLHLILRMTYLIAPKATCRKQRLQRSANSTRLGRENRAQGYISL
jgi:hypothetical protein